MQQEAMHLETLESGRVCPELGDISARVCNSEL